MSAKGRKRSRRRAQRIKTERAQKAQEREDAAREEIARRNSLDPVISGLVAKSDRMDAEVSEEALRLLRLNGQANETKGFAEAAKIYIQVEKLRLERQKAVRPVLHGHIHKVEHGASDPGGDRAAETAAALGLTEVAEALRAESATGDSGGIIVEPDEPPRSASRKA